MKKSVLPLALFLLLSVLPIGADAAWQTSPQCQTILSLTAVSPYVSAVLQRAEDGLSAAHSADVDPQFKLFEWTWNVRSAFASLINNQLALTTQSDDLLHNTACLRFDEVAIECKIDQVRQEMNAQLQRGSFIAIQKLQTLLVFLNDRLTQLKNGALDPSYSDPTWKQAKRFDPVNATFDTAMCPYDSDYGPSQQNGYGCDVDVLQSRTAFTPLKQEYDALTLISDQLKQYQESAQQFLKVQKSIDDLTHTHSTLPDPPGPRTHLSANGCGWTGGYCRDTPTKTCMSDDECGDGGVCVYPTKVCEGNRSVTCINDFSCTNPDGSAFGPCVDQDGKHPAKTELRGPFSLQKNELELLLDFLAQRVEEGNSRLFKDSLKTPEEYSSDQSSLSNARANDGFLNTMLRSSTRLLYSAWSRIQGKEEAASFPYSTDPQLEVANALSPLRSSVRDLANLTKLGDQKDSLRAFVVKFAYFLRRSCVYRPCTDSLDEVLKIVFTDDCFPYTNGEFLMDDETNPRSKKCADAAQIAVP